MSLRRSIVFNAVVATVAWPVSYLAAAPATDSSWWTTGVAVLAFLLAAGCTIAVLTNAWKAYVEGRE